MADFAPFRPANDLLLVRRHVEDNSTVKGFIIPEKFREQSNRGIVLGIGDLVDVPLRVGDRITFGVYNAETYVQDGEELLLIRSNDVRGVESLLDAE